MTFHTCNWVNGRRFALLIFRETAYTHELMIGFGPGLEIGFVTGQRRSRKWPRK